MRGGLGRTGRAVLVRTTCVGGVPCIGDPRVVRRVVHHATVLKLLFLVKSSLYFSVPKNRVILGNPTSISIIQLI